MSYASHLSLAQEMALVSLLCEEEKHLAETQARIRMIKEALGEEPMRVPFWSTEEKRLTFLLTELLG